jgi:hypothetical protein
MGGDRYAGDVKAIGVFNTYTSTPPVLATYFEQDENFKKKTRHTLLARTVQAVQEFRHIAVTGLHRNPIDPYIIRKLRT